MELLDLPMDIMRRVPKYNQHVCVSVLFFRGCFWDVSVIFLGFNVFSRVPGCCCFFAFAFVLLFFICCVRPQRPPLPRFRVGCDKAVRKCLHRVTNYGPTYAWRGRGNAFDSIHTD